MILISMHLAALSRSGRHTGQNDTGLGLAEVLGHLPEEGLRQERGGDLLTLKKNIKDITI